MIVWHSSLTPPESEETVWIWDGLREGGNIRSLLHYVEANSERLRARYLAWVHDLGEYRVKGRPVIDHLALAGDTSFWWLTLFVEKSIYKSPLADAIRLLALDEILRNEPPLQVCYVGESPEMRATVGDLCRGLGVAFEARRSGEPPRPQPLAQSIYRRLPWRLQALISLLRHARSRWPLRRSPDATQFHRGTATVFFCGYFFNLDAEMARKGKYVSRYWGGLSELIERLKLKSNWLELYIVQDDIPSPDVALDWLDRFNGDCERNEQHAFVQRYLGIASLARTLWRWLRLQIQVAKLRSVRAAFTPAGSALSLWPLLHRDWANSLHGPASVSALLWSELFDQAFQHMPEQTLGFYLCENQAWERAMLAAWRRHGHGRIVAVPHATVRYWDLRCFADRRTLAGRASFPLPQPDLYALNGDAARDAFVETGYPAGVLAEVEALRYEHLSQTSIRPDRAEQNMGPLRVLLLGDYLSSATDELLRLVSDAVPLLQDEVRFAIKPHPNCPVRAADYPALAAEVTSESMAEILWRFDVACASNLTSAAVDAFLSGVPVLVMNDAKSLNFSPLRGQPGVRFVSTSAELKQALSGIAGNTVTAGNATRYFYLDRTLPRWRRLLAQHDDAGDGGPAPS